MAIKSPCRSEFEWSVFVGCLGLSTGCLEPDRLCDANKEDVSLKPIAKGVDLSGWWIEDSIRPATKWYVDTEQRPRNDFFVEFDPDFSPGIEVKSYDSQRVFGCGEYWHYPLVLGGVNRKAEELILTPLAGSTSAENGSKLREVTLEEGVLCLHYTRYYGSYETAKFVYCYKYDEQRDRLYVAYRKPTGNEDFQVYRRRPPGWKFVPNASPEGEMTK